MRPLTADSFIETPYWHVGEPVPALSNSLSKDLDQQHVDVAIVGAGFTGLSTALHLLKAGLSVTLFDALPLGHGASGKNGGMVGPSLHKLGFDGLKNIYGEQKAYAILQEGMNAIQYLQDFVTEENLDCDLNMSGRLTGVRNQQQLDAMATKCEHLAKLKNFSYRLIENKDISSEIGSDHYYAGVVFGQDGGLQPFKLVTALANKVLQLGGKIYDQTRVSELTQKAGKHYLVTDRGSLTADQVVIASNAYNKRFAPKSLAYFSKRLLPLTSAMIATQELPEATIKALFPHGRMHGGNHRLVQYYRPSPDGKRVLFGARGVDFWDRAKVNGANLQLLMQQIFPQLKGVKIDYAWSGKVAYTFDHGPHIGQHDGLFYAMGYSGSGVTRSVYLAKKLAMQMLGETGYQTEFHNLEFQTKPFYNGTPWFMPPLIKWHGLLDRMGR